MSAPCLNERIIIQITIGSSPLLEQYLHALRLGLERCPEEWSEPCAVLSVDLCTQVEEDVTHARLVPEDGIHEWSPPSMVSVVDSILNSLSIAIQ